MTKLRVKVLEVFVLGDGSTVLAAEIDRSIPRIDRREARLFVSGEFRQLITLDGEIMLEGGSSSKFRGVSTRDKVELTSDEAKGKSCMIELG